MIGEILLSKLINLREKVNHENIKNLISSIEMFSKKGDNKRVIDLLKSLEETNNLFKEELELITILKSLLIGESNTPIDGLESLNKIETISNSISNIDQKNEYTLVLANLLILKGEYNDGLKLLSELELKLKINSDLDSIKMLISLDNLRGHVAFKKGELNQASMLLENNLKVYSGIASKKDTSYALNLLGIIEYYQGNLEKSYDFHKKSFELRKEIGNVLWSAVTLTNIGLIYYDKGEFDKALEYFNQGLALYKEINDQKSIALSYNNIGLIYSERGYFDIALDYHWKSLILNEEIGNKHLIASSLTNISTIYFEMGDYNVAINFLSKALELYNDIGNKIYISLALANLSAIYHSMKDVTKIQELLRQFPDEPYETEVIRAYQNIIKGYLDQLNGNSGNAISYWQKALNSNTLDFSFEIKCMGLLITQYFISWRLTESDQIYQHILSLLDRLEELSINNNLNPSLCNILLLRAKLSLANNEYTVGETYLTEGLLKAQESGLKMHKKLFEKEIKDLHVQVEKLNAFNDVHNKIDLASNQQINSYFENVSKRFPDFMLKLFDEKEKNEELLLNLLPKEVIPYLKDNSKLYTEEFENVSILFADMVGFTQLSEQLEPKKIVRLLNEIFSYFDSLLVQFNAEKIRTIGDNYMVCVGAPKKNENHAQNIAKLSLAMIEYIKRPRNDGININFRIGINSGSVIASVIGKNRLQFDLWSDTVNVASRMESHGLPGKIHITNNTYLLIKDEFDCESRGKIDIKSKGKMETWFLNSKKIII